MKITPIPNFSINTNREKKQNIKINVSLKNKNDYSLYCLPKYGICSHLISMKGVLKDASHVDVDFEFIKLRDDFSNMLEPLNIKQGISSWLYDNNSSEENLNNLFKIEFDIHELFEKNENLYKQLKKIESVGLKDEHLKVQLKKMLRNFDDELNTGEQKKALANKEREISTKYNSYVPQIDGKNTTVAEIRKILETEKDVKIREKAYNAIVKGGDLIADDIVKLVKMRNEFAKSKGYKNFFEYSLKEIYDVDSEKLPVLLNNVYEKAKVLNKAFQEKNKKDLANVYGVATNELKQYHYGFLLENSPENEVNKSLKNKEQVVDIAKNAYKNMGYDIDKMPILLDLYPRKYKNTHCFGYEIDAGKDTRILANLTNNANSIGTLCHELGHCVYFLGVDKNLPYFDKATHDALSEAVAMLMEDLMYRENVLKGNVPEKTISDLKNDYKNVEAKFINRSLQIIDFEKSMYENPNQDLGKLWHDLRCKYLGANENESVDNEWATIPHYLSYPVYYQNYFRANIMKSQMYNYLTKILGDLTENKNTAEFLRENLFKFGTSKREDELIEYLTKEPLSADYLCNNLK